MANQPNIWDESWLTLNADELYGRCRSLWESASCLDHDSSFHEDSAPYLMATEFPWSGISHDLVRNGSVLTVAGSGDLPLFFCRQGARQIVAVDVSRIACTYNELKREAVIALPYRSALRFFLAGLTGAEGFLVSRGESASMDHEERQRIYTGLRQELSHSARIHWDREFGGLKGTESPFRSFRGPTGLCFLDGIPYLANEKTYESWRRTVQPYPIMQAPVQRVIADSPLRFDVLYLSNVLEYWREDHVLRGTERIYRRLLEEFLVKAWDKVSPGGCIYFYMFGARESQTFKVIRKDLGLLERLGGCEESAAIITCSKWLSGSRFRNTLTGFHKPLRITSQ